MIHNLITEGLTVEAKADVLSLCWVRWEYFLNASTLNNLWVRLHNHLAKA